MADLEREERWMREAIEAAKQGLKNAHGGPFGAVIVKGDKLIARGWNQVTSTNDPTAHAEVVAIREACRILGSYQLDGCELYTSCEPCPMCLGAIYWARPDRFWYAALRDDAATGGFDDSFIYNEIPLDPSKRRIVAREILREEAIPLFDLWKNSEHRKEY